MRYAWRLTFYNLKKFFSSYSIKNSNFKVSSQILGKRFFILLYLPLSVAG